ncbi:MAG: DUF554 domain-containing protein [Selenomonadaceae bacterium]|nr:DUF554 domain-containing protein [Selenomonadaceae bacterium]
MSGTGFRGSFRILFEGLNFAGGGTVINVAAILAGGIIGLTGGKFLTERIQQTLQMACAVAVIFIGISGTLENYSTMLLIASLIGGGLVGEIIDIDGAFEKFGVWLRGKSGNDGDAKFVDAFVTASLTVCIGAMAVIGAINDRLLHDQTILIAKAALDLIIILVMTASLGKGCVFSCVSVGIFQGAITIFAGLLEPFMTEAALKNLSCVGSALIFCVGVNLMFGQKIRVANLLPALVVAILWE